MKIDMLLALSSNEQNSANIKDNQSENEFLSILDTELKGDNTLEYKEKDSISKSIEKNEDVEIDDNLAELIGILFNNINSNENIKNFNNDTELILNKNIESNFINSGFKNSVNKEEEKVDNLFKDLKPITNYKQKLDLNELINSSEFEEKLVEVDLSEEEIKKITKTIEKAQFNIKNTDLIDNSLIKKDIAISKVDRYIGVSDELEIMSNFRVASIEDIDVKSLDSNNLQISNLSNNQNNKTNKGKVFSQVELIGEESKSSINIIEANDHISDDLVNKNNNELNILNTIALNKSNNPTEVELNVDMVNSQVIRSEYISEDFVKTIKYLKSNNTEEITVKMNPKDLGELNIKILKSNNDEKVIVTLSNEDTFNLLKDNIAEIKSHLSSLEINIKEISVEIRSNNQNDFSDNLNQHFNKNNTKEEKQNKQQVLQENDDNYLEDDSLNIDLII